MCYMRTWSRSLKELVKNCTFFLAEKSSLWQIHQNCLLLYSYKVGEFFFQFSLNSNENKCIVEKFETVLVNNVVLHGLLWYFYKAVATMTASKLILCNEYTFLSTASNRISKSISSKLVAHVEPIINSVRWCSRWPCKALMKKKEKKNGREFGNDGIISSVFAFRVNDSFRMENQSRKMEGIASLNEENSWTFVSYSILSHA